MEDDGIDEDSYHGSRGCQEQNPVAGDGNGLEIVKRNGEEKELLFCDEL